MNNATNDTTNGNSNSNASPTPASATATAAATLSGIATSLQNDVLVKKERALMAKRSARCPDELINLVCQVAADNGGSVLGMSYDVQAAKDGLTKVGQLQTQLSVARQLVQRLEDEVVQTRVGVADPTFAIYTALRRLTKTAKGNALLPAYQQMQQAVKNRPRKTRGPKKPKQPGIRALRKAAKEAEAAKAAGTQQVPPVVTGGGTPPKA